MQMKCLSTTCYLYIFHLSLPAMNKKKKVHAYTSKRYYYIAWFCLRSTLIFCNMKKHNTVINNKLYSTVLTSNDTPIYSMTHFCLSNVLKLSRSSQSAHLPYIQWLLLIMEFNSMILGNSFWFIDFWWSIDIIHCAPILCQGVTS